ncbi:helix-turn-helix domain-containing protein [Lentzea californiensis]|uniref:helix-turn-helix domain-containing protein n=1 Tax=Lentzea californiensis TaxID=438851 RepID=UPI002165E10F|nr:AraC family transcriptional regulator [Lentzea californiensis]MCR3750440.1 AraC-type DNA-binding protein [Lentzea californiensis]
MDEFASAVLVAAVQHALTAEGIAVPAPAPIGALVPLAAKRRLLTEITQEHGLLPLLRVGRYLPQLPPDPAISALTAAGTPSDLFDRWSRLERFVHSRHRVVVHAACADQLVAEHVGRSGTRPEPAEDVLVLGVLAALMTAIGTRGVVVTLEPHHQVVYADGVLTPPETGRGTALWRFTWSGSSPEAPAQVTGTDVATRARHLLAGDLARGWTLRELAARFGTSARTLQRTLQPAGGFTALLATARADAAADLLMNTTHPLGIVGFACGYTDQPHLTREFKRRTAMTPAAYRSAFTRQPAKETSA